MTDCVERLAKTHKTAMLLGNAGCKGMMQGLMLDDRSGSEHAGFVWQRLCHSYPNVSSNRDTRRQSYLHEETYFNARVCSAVIIIREKNIDQTIFLFCGVVNL